MNILLVSCRYYPEPFTITRIAEGLSSLGNNVTVVTGTPNSGKWKIYEGYENVKEETINGIRVIRLKEYPRKKGVFGLIRNYSSIYFSFKKYFKKNKDRYDVVFSHVMSPVFSISEVGKYCKKNKIPHFHYGFDLWPESLIATGYLKRWNLLFKFFKIWSKRIYEKCDLISFASPSCEKYFKQYLKIDVPFTHIYQPCLTNIDSLNWVSYSQKISNDKIHLLFCGTIAKFNHLDLLVEALNDKTLQEKLIVDIVGSGSDQKRIEKIAKKIKLNNIIFHGRVTPEETATFYSKSDAIFIPLYYNSATSLMIPQKVIESFMHGRMIVGMIKGDGKDLIEHASDKNILVDQTPKSIRDGLLKLVEIPQSVFEKCGKENRLFYKEHKEFSIDSVCSKMNNLMLKLINNKNK